MQSMRSGRSDTKRADRKHFPIYRKTWALKAQGRRVIVVDDAELDDDLVRDMTEVLTSFCARLYGRRAAKHRAQAALEAMRGV